MPIVDVNTWHGSLSFDKTDLSLNRLLRVLRAHAVTQAFTSSLKGIYYDFSEGNQETLATSLPHPELLPVATVDPRRHFGCEEEVRQRLVQGCRLFRFYPELQGWRVDSAPFRCLLAPIAAAQVPVMLAAPSWGAASQIAQVTAESGVPAILTGVNYWHMSEVIALLREYPHLFVETHKIDTPDGIEVLVSEVGAERLLFGSGSPLYHIGSALRIVNDAEITQEHRERILWRNAARLFGLELRADSPHQMLGSGEPSSDIVDVHAHLGAWPFPIKPMDVKEMLRLMRRYGIQSSIVSSVLAIVYDVREGNSLLARAIDDEPALWGYVVLNPNDISGSCEEMDRCYQSPKFVGAKIHPAYSRQPIASEATRALVAEVTKRGKPLLIHTWGREDARALGSIAQEHPDLKVIMGHGGGDDWRAGIAAAMRAPNLYLEFCGAPPHLDIIDEAVGAVGAERVLFGTDLTLLNPGLVLGMIEDARLTPVQRRCILSDNARALFGLQPDDSGE